MKIIKHEHCFVCNDLTGRAGIHDDSLYCAECGDGPFCDKCNDIHCDEHNRQNNPHESW